MVAHAVLFLYINSQIRTDPETLALYRRPNEAVGEHFLIGQLLTLLAGLSAVALGQDDRLAVMMIMGSLLIGAYGLAVRFLDGPPMEPFRKYGLGRFLVGGLGCLLFSAVTAFITLLLLLYQFVMLIGGEPWLMDRVPWKERWILCASFATWTPMWLCAIFSFNLRDQLSQYAD